MNRPFYAFGALLTAVALSMLAVSSTSRSTSVGPAAPALSSSSAAGPAGPKLRQRTSFCSMVVVLPAGHEVDRIAHIAAGSAECLTYASLTGASCPMEDWEDEETDESDWDCRDYCPLMIARSEPRPVGTVQLAGHDPAQLRDETSRDCRSHYDPAYDLVVYGEVDSPPRGPSRSPPPMVASGLPSPIEWSDYAELMDEALAVRPPQPTSAESISSVRSSRRLLDFAARALKDAGSLLHSAGEQLHNAAAPVAKDHVAGEPQVSPR